MALKPGIALPAVDAGVLVAGGAVVDGGSVVVGFDVVGFAVVVVDSEVVALWPARTVVVLPPPHALSASPAARPATARATLDLIGKERDRCGPNPLDGMEKV
jgi:hypothetical protein